MTFEDTNNPNIQDRQKMNTDDCGVDPKASQRQERYTAFLAALEPARAHFKESGRQFALGTSVSIGAISELLNAMDELPGNRNFATGLELLRSLTDIWIGRIQPLEDKYLHNADIPLQQKLDALFNLRAVLQAELDRTPVGTNDEPASSPTTMQEIIGQILNGINQEIERLVQESNPKSDDPVPHTYEVQIGDTA